jgi:hypothetical protein
MKAVGSTLWGSLTGSGAATGPGGSSATGNITALSGVGSAFDNFSSDIQKTQEQIWALVASTVGKAAYKGAYGHLYPAVAGRVLTPEEQALVNSNPTSLDPFNANGRKNLSNLTGAVDSIQALGTELLKEGKPINEVITAVKQYRDQLEAQAAGLGFNIDAVKNLVDQLGLSDEALSSFADAVASAGAAAGTAADSQTQQPDGPPPPLSATQQAIQTQLQATFDQITAGGGSVQAEVQAVKAMLQGLGIDTGQIPDAYWAGITTLSQLAEILGMLTNTTITAPDPTGGSGSGSTPPPNAPDTSPPYLPGPNVTYNNHLYLPYGDPDAVALAVINRQAQSAMVPG